MYRALRSFSGLVNMIQGEIKDIPDKAIANDLLACGYIERVDEAVEEIAPVTEEPVKEEPKETKPKKKRTPKGA